jgi:hypothetical protein
LGTAGWRVSRWRTCNTCSTWRIEPGMMRARLRGDAASLHHLRSVSQTMSQNSARDRATGRKIKGLISEENIYVDESALSQEQTSHPPGNLPGSASSWRFLPFMRIASRFIRPPSTVQVGWISTLMEPWRPGSRELPHSKQRPTSKRCLLRGQQRQL